MDSGNKNDENDEMRVDPDLFSEELAMLDVNWHSHSPYSMFRGQSSLVHLSPPPSARDYSLNLDDVEGIGDMFDVDLFAPHIALPPASVTTHRTPHKHHPVSYAAHS